MCKKYGLYCYAGAGKNDKMYLGNDEDTNDYIKEYRLFLKILWDYIDDWRKWGGSSGWGPYEDPDRLAGNKRINPKFYSDLCVFLNAKVKKGKEYIFNGKFIEYGDINLVSDQFGFAAPSLGLSHPYDMYLIKCKIENKKDAIDKVVNWVMESRTIGGSFLWPEGICRYNADRGGRNPFDVEGKYRGGRYSKYYIEDRVDLTLCEIKHYFDNKNYEGDILYNHIKKDSVEEEWFRSFGDFKGYVDFFCFEPFVDKNNDYMPYDIVNSNFATGEPKCIDDEDDNYRNREKNSIFQLSAEELETMFNNVNAMIKKRSNNILCKNMEN